uniref:RND family efflux transporter, MFP subunit n=1 Tax=Candidatus Kentrum sp. DK TaxID=2126562 RepID=A0A450SZX6_9GAMM|nr:MAG: RND family efflux transporter, MFP subunit [Candidatus Kentron sp. DK]
MKVIKPKFIAPVLVLAISAIAGGLLIITAPEAERRVPPPVIPTVEVMPLRAQDHMVTLASRGTVSPRTKSTLIAEVAGRVTGVSPDFRPGGFFEAGDVLLTLDARDYENTVTMMRSELAQTRLALEEERARVEQAHVDWKRFGESGSPSGLVLRKPQLASKQAAVDAAMAKLRQAELELERTRVTAPYAGRILEKSVDIGQYVTPGALLASLYAIDYVEVRLPLTDEQIAFVDLPETYRGASRPERGGAVPPGEGRGDMPESPPEPATGPPVTVSARIGGKDYQWTGNVVRVEGSIDIQTRQVFVVAKIDDPYAPRGGRPPLKVGTFVKAEIQGRVLTGIFVIPMVAVHSGDRVWLVDENEKLEQRQVEVLWRNAGQVIIGEGLDEGELLVLTPLPYGISGTTVGFASEGGGEDSQPQ